MSNIGDGLARLAPPNPQHWACAQTAGLPSHAQEVPLAHAAKNSNERRRINTTDELLCRNRDHSWELPRHSIGLQRLLSNALLAAHL
jgi:hypothetical protein